MFAGRADAKFVASEIATKLADHKEFKSHGRHINRNKAKKEIGLIIDDLEEDQEFQDLILSVFHATTHTFNGTNAVKIIENHKGMAFINQQRILIPQGPPSAKQPTEHQE